MRAAGRSLASSGGAFGQTQSENSIASHPDPGSSLGIASVSNLRDLGGYIARGSFAVRSKVLYRSSQLNPVSAGDLMKIAELDLTSDFDLRTAAERAKFPDVLPRGVRTLGSTS